MNNLREFGNSPCRSGNKPSRCAAPVSLAEAREEALANRKLARSGGDPLADKRRVQGVPTFAEAGRACWSRSGAAGAAGGTGRTGGGSLELRHRYLVRH